MKLKPMSLRSIALMLCVASILGCKATERSESELPHAGAGGTGDASNLAAASGQGGAAGTGSLAASGDGGGGGTHAMGEPIAGGAGDPVGGGDEEPTLSERAAEDQATLRSCGAPSPCAATAVGIIEGLHATPLASEFECVLTALAQRTPGLYRHQTSHSLTNGSWQASHTLLIQADGSALYTRTVSGSVGFPPDFESMPIEGAAAGQRCALKPASYFETCLETANGASADPELAALSTACVSDGSLSAPGQLPWIESCEDASPLATLECESSDQSSTLPVCSEGTHDIPSLELASILCKSISGCILCERPQQLEDAGTSSTWSVFEYECRCPPAP
jgi:hypothetical protein